MSSITANNAHTPYWWQRLCPRYGNYGGVGWSGGEWCNDPSATKWGVPAIDEMDHACRLHDWQYQHDGDLDIADLCFVEQLRDIIPDTIYGKFYRILAMTTFTVWPWIRRRIK